MIDLDTLERHARQCAPMMYMATDTAIALIARVREAEARVAELEKALPMAERWIDDHAAGENNIRGGVLIAIRAASIAASGEGKP